MFKKDNIKLQIIISSIFLTLTVGLFSISVFGVLEKPYNSHILLNHFFIGLAMGLYVFIMLQINLKSAFTLFILGYVFSFGTLFYVYSRASDGFSELAGFMGWTIIMLLVIALGITLEILLSLRKKEKEKQYTFPEDEVVDVELIEENHED